MPHETIPGGAVKVQSHGAAVTTSNKLFPCCCVATSVALDESNIDSKRVPSESNLMFSLSSDKDQRKNSEPCACLNTIEYTAPPPHTMSSVTTSTRLYWLFASNLLAAVSKKFVFFSIMMSPQHKVVCDSRFKNFKSDVRCVKSYYYLSLSVAEADPGGIWRGKEGRDVINFWKWVAHPC